MGYSYDKMMAELKEHLDELEAIKPDDVEITKSIREITTDFANVIGALEQEVSPVLATLLTLLATRALFECLREFDFSGCEEVIAKTRERMIALGYRYGNNGEPLL